MCFCEISFKCYINQRLEYRNLTKVIATELLTNCTFVLSSIPKWQFLIIFCYTELLFLSHSESDRSLVSSRTSRFKMSRSRQLFEYRSLTKVIAARVSTNFTFVLQQISKSQFLILFCYTELLFLSHSESERPLIYSTTSRSESLEIFFQKYSEKIPRKANVVAPNLSNIFRKKMSVMKCLCLVFITLKASQQHIMKLTNKKEWLHLFNTIINEKFVMKEKYK